jgi:two-component system, OmpR family, response regulator
MRSNRLSHILYVDDDPDLRMIVKIALEQFGGFDLQTCASGAEALEKARASRPDMILLDVMMPGMDGLRTLSALREIPTMNDVPVIFLTAKAQAHELSRYRDAGAVDIIVKPFDPLQLPTLLRTAWEACTETGSAHDLRG